MKKSILLICLFLLRQFASSQSVSIEYTDLLKKARDYYAKKEYINAATTFSTITRLPNYNATIIDNSRASFAWALAGIPDSAFFYLDKIAVNKTAIFTDYISISNDPDFSSLYTDERWKNKMDKIFLNANQNFQKNLLNSNGTISNSDRKNASVAWALHNSIDSALHQLKLISASATLTFEDANDILIDDNLKPLHKDVRWNEIEKSLFENLNKKFIPPSAFGKRATNKRILIDEGHYNLHTLSETYRVISGVLTEAGFKVGAHKEKFTTSSLANADILIIGNPFPDLRDSLVRRSQRNKEPFRFSTAANKPAIDEHESLLIKQWVDNGGSLLLLLDHAPHGITGSNLTKTFGIKSNNVVTSDSLHSDTAIRNPTILFTRKSGMIGEHPILKGVDSVVTYVGQSLTGPAESTIILKLSSSAIDTEWDPTTKQYISRPTQGNAQAIAFQSGKGKVVFMGEAAGINAISTSRSDRGNWKFTLNILRWLSGNLK